MLTQMNKLSFSGHESFVCKHFWLRKAFDFVNAEGAFKDEQAVVFLGVGKNMVSSIRHWGKAFSILSDLDKPTDLANYLFGSKGRDPYLEDSGSLWLLHYHLVATRRASIYNLVFNEFRKERIDFEKDQLLSFLKRKCDEYDISFNAKTVQNDIAVFLRTYLRPEKTDKVEVEDSFASLLIGLDLVHHFKHRNLDGDLVDTFRIEPADRPELPAEIVLYSILEAYPSSMSISFRSLLSDHNAPGSVFCLTPDGLMVKIQEIVSSFPGISFSETAGNLMLQIRTRPKQFKVLDSYYV